MAARATVYGTRFCGYCVAATRHLEARGFAVDYVALDGDPQLRAQLRALTGRSSVPQVFIGDRHVGGYSDLRLLDQAGELAQFLADSGPAEGNASAA